MSDQLYMWFGQESTGEIDNGRSQMSRHFDGFGPLAFSKSLNVIHNIMLAGTLSKNPPYLLQFSFSALIVAIKTTVFV